MERPTQAVILAGGRGTRLRPLTDTRPKAMVLVHGKPFLEYQIEQLREQGFTRVLLLLGYRAQVIREHFGDGGRWGVRIDYSVTPVEDETAWRLERARHLFDRHFLLMYCDNYWPLDFDRHWRRFRESGCPAMITVYTNRDGYTQNSVRVEPDGKVSLYDKSCSRSGLNGVEISYAILSREVLDLLPGENTLFETAVYPELARRGELAAFVTEHRYYSIGSLRKLPLTEEFFRRRKTILLDRDGVLNEKPPPGQYVERWRDFRWLPGTLPALRLLHQSGYRIIVISNQAGVARGAISLAELDRIHARMRREAEAAGGAIDAIYCCTHGWDEGCGCRKPKPGLLFQAQRDFQLDLSRTVFIGDDERDAQAAAEAGCRFMAVREDTALISCVARLLGEETLKENIAHAGTAHG
ncbi:MAG TPA: HAD-IIIA family hydrolase [Candidatus Eisenbacteria bacterium]|nr:HAD-IIIA family hydrolase [Candidatus Eisenbacteria bacterium]